ncbi:hypothetical protein M378DRAFT_9186 [Amanita muscaria Koide BX008]|uniref:DNA polymerase alpha subunit B n=1 Tax=Amanita muscaria (strain Koide BX008) TaxID=946122 RepID=A0A0C2X1D7_AMAMK|nr:hypothetical protein M378DRAFT_9186 [Amanita muscaria Koide BX008]
MSSIEAIREGLLLEFKEAIPSDGEIMHECISLCQMYNLSPQALLWKWEVIKLGKGHSALPEISALDMNSVAAMKAQITRDLLKESTKKKQQARINQSSVVPANLNRRYAAGSANIAPDQVKTESTSDNLNDSVAVSYRGPKADEDSRKRRAYRYMYEKVSERSEALDDRIDELAELVRDHYGLTELGDPSSSTDGDTTVVGRIIQDIEAAGSSTKLNETTICLESSRMLGSGSRIPLRFDPTVKIRGCITGAGSLGFFPGAIVALRGRNGGGGWFQVSEILGLPLPRSTPSAGLSAMKIDPDMAGSPFSMSIACGPYTSDTDLHYRPRELYFEHIKKTKPGVVLLMGPFVDSSHPKVKIGDLDSTPSRLYQIRFLTSLKSFLQSSPHSKVLLLPSIRDLLSDHAVYPQGEYPQLLTENHPRIHLLPNPARFTINGVTFAGTSVDVLFHLKREEYLKRGEEVEPIAPTATEDVGTDAMGNLCRHLLQQRSFYPLFPVPIDVSLEVNLDISHSDGLRLCNVEDQYAPDVLILPSKLKEFAKTIHSTYAINPSYINKLRYATLEVASGAMPVKDRINLHLAKFENNSGT